MRKIHYIDVGNMSKRDAYIAVYGKQKGAQKFKSDAITDILILITGLSFITVKIMEIYA